MSKIKDILQLVRKFGSSCTLKLILKRLGFSKITPYHSFKFPLTDLKFKVVFRNNYWLELEKGTTELNIIKFLIENVRESQIILDVGAWIGPFTLLLSKLVGPKGKIISFEPDSSAYKVLEKNVKKNKLKNVYLEKLAVSNFEGTTQLNLFNEGGGSTSSLVRHKEEDGLKCEEVKTITLDKYCKENGIIPNGLKIDVEGVEGAVIEGFQKFISQNSLWALIEFHGVFMNAEEKVQNWQKILKSSKNVIFMSGNALEYQPETELKEMPKCNYFHMLVLY